MGILTPNDLKQALFHNNFFASKETVYNLIAEYDDDGLGGISFESFVKIIGSDPSQTETTSDLKKIFRKLWLSLLLEKGYLLKIILKILK